jgi:tetratricopeptide (TPR) repeat protein
MIYSLKTNLLLSYQIEMGKLALIGLGIIAFRRTISNQDVSDRTPPKSSQAFKNNYSFIAGTIAYAILIFTVPIVDKLTKYIAIPAFAFFLIVRYGYLLFINIIVSQGFEGIIKKKYDKAIPTFSFLIKKYPNWGLPYQYRGYAYYKSDYKEKALTDFSKAIDYLSPSSDNYKLVSKAIQAIQDNENIP